MTCRMIAVLALASALAVAQPAGAQEVAPASPLTVAAPATSPPPSPATAAPLLADLARDQALPELAAALAALPPAASEPERKDREALTAFYAARGNVGLWVDAAGFSARAKLLREAFAGAERYGLDASAFDLPKEGPAGNPRAGNPQTGNPQAMAQAEIKLTTAALAYARFARGGRIADPITQLSPNLDRRPQWVDPKTVLEALGASADPGAYLTGLNPKHAQFERLRALYDAEIDKAAGKGKLTAAAKHLRANMEMWRWMPDDMGTQSGDENKGMYVFNNIPEFLQYVYLNGDIIRTERIVVGQLDKQSAVFSRPLKYVVLRPLWRVPESIAVNEIWPGLIKGGRVMRRYGMELQTKDDKPVDWQSLDWGTTDIRHYDVVQPPGPRSVLGHVKFSFPSQHTIYMHDTPDKYMFNASVRTLSHGCLRVRNPMQLAEIILAQDKGWDAAKIAELDKTGPLNNEVPIEKRIPIHVAYFTAWVDAAGHLKNFPDIYGHEKRVTLALDGQWDRIDHGRDDQAPVEPNFNPQLLAAKVSGDAPPAAADDPFASGGKGKAGKGGDGSGGPIGDLLSALFGG